MLASQLVRNLKAVHLLQTVVLIFLLPCSVVTASFAQTFSVLYSFSGAKDGGNPSEGLVLDSVGNLYGTTQYGGLGNCSQYGLNGCGTVFEVSNKQTEAVLYSFKGGSDGEYPWGGLALDGQGNLFGTTVNGGLGLGVVFSLDETDTEKIIHRFTGGTDGAYPYSGLTLDHAGHVFGTNTSGGNSSCGYEGEGCGTLFKIGGNRGTIVHRFAGAPFDGNFPEYGAVLIDGTGNLYGATSEGGAANYGTVYKIDRNGKYTLVYSFSGTSDGCEPSGSLAADVNGSVYGATSACGDLNRGTIFRISSTGSFSVLYTFGVHGTGDGNAPFGGVLRDRNGNLYGTTLFGGDCSFSESGCGTVFKLSPNGTMTILHSFDGYTDGSSPWCNVIMDEAGNLFGTTSIAGPGGAGTIWKIAP